jgi:N-acyl-D-amino-acid deacylase
MTLQKPNGESVSFVDKIQRRKLLKNLTLWEINDRGVIAPGLRANLNRINSESLTCDTPIMAYDLPANGCRLAQHAKTYQARFANGEQIVASDEFTETLPDKLLRETRHQALASSSKFRLSYFHN